MGKNAMQRLNECILEKNSRICAGLDPTWENIPESSKRDNRFGKDQKFSREVSMIKAFRDYCREYIDAICDIVPAIKINSAFFEQYGLEDLYYQLAKESKDKGLFVIGDVKRADIGNTSAAYAEAFLGKDSPFDAITINPYFGTDGVMPFLKLAKENGKGVFILVKTSNKSSAEIQDLKLEDGRYVYEAVADLVLKWAKEVDPENFEDEAIPYYPMVGAVVGATHPEQAENLVNKMGDMFFLVPGYGVQGATANDIVVNFTPNGTGAIVNSSRGIMNAYKSDRWKDIYPEDKWAEASRAEAIRATEEINKAIEECYNIGIKLE